MAKQTKTKTLTGHEQRQIWLKSLKVGQTVFVRRPAHEGSDTFCANSRHRRNNVLCSGKVVERNRVSVTVEWEDLTTSFSGGSTPVRRITKVLISTSGLYEGSDNRDSSYGLCIFPDRDSCIACLDAIDFLKHALPYSYSGILQRNLKLGTTREEAEDCLRAMSICLNFARPIKRQRS